MAHFAQLDENNVVTKVILVGNDDTSDLNGVEAESIGVAFCQKHHGVDTNWKQTSYNGNMRVRYASVGDSYNAELDAFVPEQPWASWILDNATANWVSPIGAAPGLTFSEVSAGANYTWDESAYQADNTKGWKLNT
tara:strand:- start:101 stop:508 length:408 start_codon:yes stop_codon:yes gene_type:complete